MAFDTAMALAAKFASQPPISAAMTKLSNNCPDARARQAHQNVDQFALTTLTGDHREGVAAFLERQQAAFQRTLRPGRIARRNSDPHIHDSHKVYYGIFYPIRITDTCI
jgi:hypothetical protein